MKLPTQHVAWLDSAADCLGGRGNPLVQGLKARVADCGMSPMRHGVGPKRLRPIGAAETGEPSDVPWLDDADLAHRAAALARQSLAVEMPRIPAASKGLAALKQAFAGRGFVITRDAPGTPFIDLDASWAEPESKFNAGRRSDFRRAQRHAEKLGALSFEIHETLDAEALDRYLDEAYGVEARSWKGEGGTALVSDATLGPFYRRYAHAALQCGILRLAFMRIGGVAVGMQLGVEFEQRLWLFKIGYDPAYAKCSPGNLLMLFTLGDAARRGLLSYEFLGSAAPWTAHWTTTLRAYLSVRFYPRSLSGALALAQDLMKSVRARIEERRAGASPATSSMILAGRSLAQGDSAAPDVAAPCSTHTAMSS